MPILGDNTQGSSSFPCSGNRSLGRKFTLSETGSFESITLFFDATSGGGLNGKGLIYAADGAGALPGTLLAVGNPVAVPAGGGGSAGLTATLVGGPITLTPADYWLLAVTDDFNARFSCAPGAGSIRKEGTTYASPANPLGTPDDTNVFDGLSIYATYSTDVTVPDVVGLSEAAATAAIEGAGLFASLAGSEYSATVPAGDVITQDPTAGSTAASGSRVFLTLSLGPEPPPPPPPPPPPSPNDLTDPKFQRPSHNTLIRWQRKVKPQQEETPPAQEPPTEPAAPTNKAPAPRSTGLGEIVPPPVAPAPVPEIKVPDIKVVAPPKAAELAAPIEAPAPPAPVPPPASPEVSAKDLARLEREMTAFVEGVVAGLAKQVATLDALLQAKGEELAVAQREIAAFKRRETNRQRAEALARQITEEE